MSKEKLSALMDGELDAAELDALLKALREDGALLEAWQDWQTASGAMTGYRCCSSQFMQRFSRQLAEEPVVMAPNRLRQRAIRVRRLLVPLTMAASVAFVGVSVWQISEPVQPSGVQIAKETESTLREYLAAHRAVDGNPFAEREVIQANFQRVESR